MNKQVISTIASLGNIFTKVCEGEWCKHCGRYWVKCDCSKTCDCKLVENATGPSANGNTKKPESRPASAIN